jgi:NAD(P)-dependent dehydrogenase (short-subunit alcohol dehydrogenase family)
VQQWIGTINANVIGPYLTCRAFMDGMLKQGWGRIVNFSSAAAFHPPGPLNSAYGTSKVALNQFTRHLAAEIAGSGVTANVIHPGEVKTEMWADIRDQAEKLGPEAEGYRKWVKWVGETGGDDPKKAAELVLKLTGEDSADVNGQFLWIEGGLQTPVKAW